MKISNIERGALASFTNGVLRIYYKSTNIEWLGKISRVEIISAQVNRGKGPFIQVNLNEDMLEREGGPFIQDGKVYLDKSQRSPWRRLNKRNFSFGENTGILLLKKTGPHRLLQVVGSRMLISLYSPSHPNR